MAFAASTSPPETLQVLDIGSLAVLCPLVERLGIANIIDQHIPTDAEFPHGKVLAVLLAARLHDPTALVNIADWAQRHGTEYLFGIPADKLNDDRLGRALDALFDKRYAILADVTHRVLEVTGLSLERVHFDTTHAVLYGAYDESVPRPSSTLAKIIDELALKDLRASPAHICRGYLTKYKMLQVGVSSVVDDLGALPVACNLVDGNRTGHVAIRQHYELYRDALGLPENFLLVSDRGTCSVEHLAHLRDHGQHALCAAPWADYGQIFVQAQHAELLTWREASYRSREQQRRRDKQSSMPLESHRLAELEHHFVHPLTKELLPGRLIFVHSSANAKEAKARRAQNIATIKAGLESIAAKLVRAHASTTTASVEGALQRLLGKKKEARFFHYELVPLTDEECAALPPPTRGGRRQTQRLIFTFDEDAARAEERDDGIAILVTLAPPSWTADALFTEYKRQTYVERGHHEFKTPLAITPIFLKTPERVEALVSLLFVALQAYMTLERLYRQTVPANAAPAEHRMTAERILRTFAVSGIYLEQHSYGVVVHAARLPSDQRRILTQLSLRTPSEFLRSILAPPPTS
jgi:transposase